MPEIDPLILQLKADNQQYKSSLNEVIALNKNVSDALLVAANKIEGAANKMAAAFMGAANADKAAAVEIAKAEAAKELAAAKSAAAAAAAAKANETGKKREADAAKEAARAAEKAARDEEKANRKAAAAAKQAAREKEIAAKQAADAINAQGDRLKRQLQGLAISFGAYFSVRELSAFSDSFTRLQNNLRVAGLEGEQLKQVQDRLFESAQKYGVEIEGLSNLFGQLTQASKELGATQGQIFQLTDAVSASLKVTGLSAQQAGGALLQLTQALRGGKIQAEEYNSLLDGLYPLLEAAAKGSDRWGGSVAKLTADVKAGKVQSAEFFAAILAGSESLEGKASQATLTLSAGLTTLNNALTVYFGEADKANGVSAALGEAFKLVADNLDTLIPAIAAIAVGLGVRYVAAATAARVASVGLSASIAALVGNPVILGLSALAGGIAYLALTANNAADETKNLTDRQRALQQVMASDAAAKAAKDTDTLARARSNLTRETLLAAKAEAELAIQQARKSFDLARRGVKEETTTRYVQVPGSRRREAVTSTEEVKLANRRGRGGDGTTELTRARAEASRQMQEATAQAQAVTAAIRDFSKGIGQAAGVRTTAAAEETKKAKKEKSPLDPDAFAREEAGLNDQILQSKRDAAKSEQERAAIELQRIEASKQAALAEIAGDERYTADQKKKIAALTEQASALQAAAVIAERDRSLAEKAADARENNLRLEQAALAAQSRVADTRQDFFEIESRILDLAEQEERARLEALIAAGQIADASKARAALEQRFAAQREDLARDTESPLERRRRDAREAAANINDALENIQLHAADTLVDRLADASTEFIKLGGIAGDVLNSIISDFVRLAAKQALFGSGSGGGLFGSIIGGIGSIFGGPKAGGGPVQAGRVYRINETASGSQPEYFQPSMSGDIIPLGQVNQMAAARVPGGNGIVRVELVLSEDLNERITGISGDVAINVVRAAGPGIANAGAAEAIKHLSRPRI